MSARFILYFRGVPMRVEGPALVTCTPDDTPTEFTSETLAWLAAHQHNLNPPDVTIKPA